MNMGKLLGQWFVYSLIIAVIVAHVSGRTLAPGAPYLAVFRVSGAVTFCCYSLALWQNWIGRSAASGPSDVCVFSLERAR